MKIILTRTFAQRIPPKNILDHMLDFFLLCSKKNQCHVKIDRTSRIVNLSVKVEITPHVGNLVRPVSGWITVALYNARQNMRIQDLSSSPFS